MLWTRYIFLGLYYYLLQILNLNFLTKNTIYPFNDKQQPFWLSCPVYIMHKKLCLYKKSIMVKRGFFFYLKHISIIYCNKVTRVETESPRKKHNLCEETNNQDTRAQPVLRVLIGGVSNIFLIGL